MISAPTERDFVAGGLTTCRWGSFQTRNAVQVHHLKLVLSDSSYSHGSKSQKCVVKKTQRPCWENMGKYHWLFNMLGVENEKTCVAYVKFTDQKHLMCTPTWQNTRQHLVFLVTPKDTVSYDSNSRKEAEKSGLSGYYRWYLHTQMLCAGLFTYIWTIFGVNVGEYSSTMEHLGYIYSYFQEIPVVWHLGGAFLKQWYLKTSVRLWPHL